MFATIRSKFTSARRRWAAVRYALSHPNIAPVLPRIYVAKPLAAVPDGALVLFPLQCCLIGCGLAGIVAYKHKASDATSVDLRSLGQAVQHIGAHGFSECVERQLPLAQHFLGEQGIETLLPLVRRLKQDGPFCELFAQPQRQAELAEIAAELETLVQREAACLADSIANLDGHLAELLAGRVEALKDAAWCLQKEVIENITKTAELLGHPADPAAMPAVKVALFKHINAVLNSIDRLEVRGRDSAGISLMFVLKPGDFEAFQAGLPRLDLLAEFEQRTQPTVLANRSITVNPTPAPDRPSAVAVCFVYKIAAEIGRLGDNIRFLRQQIKTDQVLRSVAAIPHADHTVCSHTRWASVGAITEANCHPVDNACESNTPPQSGILHVCLNGDIDNYLALKRDHEQSGVHFNKDITTDTKIIPLQIEKYLQQGHRIEEAFRLAVNDFDGSHAISMHSDLAPGKMFLAQKGSGQAIFIGLGPDHYMPTSEVYGFVEETASYLKMDGESIVTGPDGQTQGQVVILDQNCSGGLTGVTASYYDGSPVPLSEKDIKWTAITSRDIDRQHFPHYFLKEISESPVSVDKTLQNRWKAHPDRPDRYTVSLDESIIPPSIHDALTDTASPSFIRRIYFVGQGTAGVAAQACADILEHYLADPRMLVSALKASELSGFKLGHADHPRALSDTLVIAISQSGTTTDTNRTVDMVKERGAHTLAIVNRRDSDITFKVDGVMYTSSGRDVEMSVASTKAFYSQIVAGALLGLHVARIKNRRDDGFITREIDHLRQLPAQMRTVLELRGQIEASAHRHANQKTYWAAVGSGPNKSAADEIRIKLSELCYKTISSDYVEDKKHIDLSSEPLIIICAAGSRNSVIGDLIKDTAIFKAHKATPLVIADQGETRFAPYADDVFHVPPIQEHLAPILNTLVGHLWGYYAALAINDGSRVLFDFQNDIQLSLDGGAARGQDIYEVILEKSFKEHIAQFYYDFRKRNAQNRFSTVMGLNAATDLTLLLKYLAGKISVADFELDFGVKGTPRNILNKLFATLAEAINCMARPVDAIKHQAKTVTVGTSRIIDRIEGIIFDELDRQQLSPSQLTNQNILVLKNLQAIIAEITGTILYRIGALNLLGEPTDASTIELVHKTGVCRELSSRVEGDNTLKGTKRIIVRQGNVYIGKGRKDDRSILVIPVLSASADAPHVIDHLLLCNITFKADVARPDKIKALGGKYEHIKNIVQENNIVWQDEYIDRVEMEELFGRSAEKIGEFIESRVARG